MIICCPDLLQDLRATMPGEMTRPIGVKPEGSKVDRMAAQSAKIEAGHVYLPKSAAWLGEFLTELLSFPNGRHDDQDVLHGITVRQHGDDGVAPAGVRDAGGGLRALSDVRKYVHIHAA